MSVQVQPHPRWPSGSSVPLAALRFSPDELANRYGLEFERDLDDLEYYKLAAIRLPDGSQAWLERHDGDPVSNTLAHVDASANLRLAKEGLKRALDLTDEDFVWVSPFAGAVKQDNDASSETPTVG